MNHLVAKKIDKMNTLRVNKEQVHVISAITFGNILEWFEVYSFAYLAPILAQKFFSFESKLSGLMLAFLVFGVGFITRPIGGILFGRIGDVFGRKKAFVLSIILLTLPTFLIGILPTYETWGYAAPISLFILRLGQTVSTGGEIPGAVCFLFENSNKNNKRFLTSWNNVGNQIGAMIGLGESFLIENFMSPELLSLWGWRISFLSGGVIGLLGIYLRHTLHETPVFIKLKKSHHVDRKTVKHLISNYKSKLWAGIGFGAVPAATFYLIATYVPTFINDSLGLNSRQNMFVSMLILVILTVLLPFFGRLGDKYSNRRLCIGSTIFIVLLLYPLSYAIDHRNITLVSIIGVLYLIPISCISALIGYIIANLFPAQVRFTGSGITFNISDGIIGGFAPAIGILLFELTDLQSGFCWYILVCASISLISYAKALKD
jgi:MFS transporter, MHS family, proline/betaine transporter